MKETRIVPSDIVALIDRVFPASAKGQTFHLAHNQAATLQALLTLADSLSPQFLPVGGEDLVCYLASCEVIRNHLDQWKSLGYKGGQFSVTPGFGNQNPVSHIREILSKRPDTILSPAVAGLEFVPDKKYREELRADLASVESLIRSQEWKAGMVLAGSLIEALVCDYLLRSDPSAIQGAVSSLVSEKRIRNQSSDVTQWHLPAYALVAERLGAIRAPTCQQVIQGADFRNLVHPGKSIREGTRCTRGTATATVAALFLVIEDLGSKP